MTRFILCMIFLTFSISLAQDDNMVIFEGDELTEGITMNVDWSGSVEVSDEDYYSGEHCIKWVAGASWDGPQFHFPEPVHFHTWSLDTIAFMIVCDPEFGNISVWLLDDDMDGVEKEDYDFEATTTLVEDTDITYTSQWQQVKVPVSGLDRFAGRWDNDSLKMVAGEMDTTRVQQLYITCAEQEDAADKVVYLDDIKIIAGSAVSAVGESTPVQIPTSFTLEQNYPNPFNPSTTISYALNTAAHISLDVYDITGRHVATLVNGMKSAGSYSVTFDAQDLPSGIYYYQLKAENFSTTRKMVLVR
jgi:hypothetical protein